MSGVSLQGPLRTKRAVKAAGRRSVPATGGYCLLALAIAWAGAATVGRFGGPLEMQLWVGSSMLAALALLILRVPPGGRLQPRLRGSNDAGTGVAGDPCNRGALWEALDNGKDDPSLRLIRSRLAARRHRSVWLRPGGS